MNPNNNTSRVTWSFPVTNPSAEVTAAVTASLDTLLARNGAGSEMLGWVDWPAKYFESAEYGRLKATAKHIQNTSDVVVVVGIGGSYLTPKAILEAEYGDEYNYELNERGLPEMLFAGCDLSPVRLKRILNRVAGTDWSIVYISKSGGTAEPALAFRALYSQLVNDYGEDEARTRIFCVTDAEKGVLKGMADQYDWEETFVIPDDIGGRYSGLTACGLLPLAIAGIDTDALLRGAIEAAKAEIDPNSFAFNYAKWRYEMYSAGYKVEWWCLNTPDLRFFGEWYKQLFGESEGKDGKGLLPNCGVFPTDLHSLGQFLQEGTRNLEIQTFVERAFSVDLVIPDVPLTDNLESRAGKFFSQAAAAAMDGAYNAHSAGGNPCCKIRFGSSLEDLGYLMQALFVACAISAYALEVNPFDQPGVESHKRNMKISPMWDN